MNLNARTKRIEMMVNETEVGILDRVRGHVDRSPFLRGLLHEAARTHGKPPAPPKESRGCPGRRHHHMHASRGYGSPAMTRRQV